MRQRLLFPVVILLMLAGPLPVSTASLFATTAIALQDSAINVADSPSRKWESADGKFSIEGALRAIEGDKVQIETRDGKKISAAVAKLSADDQAFVRLEQKRARESSDSPFMVEESGALGAATSPSPSGNSSGGEAALDLDPDMGSTQPIDLSSDQPLRTDAEHWQPRTNPHAKKFRVRGGGFHTSATGCCATADGKLFLMSFHDPFGVELKNTAGVQEPCKAWMEMVELPSARSRGQFPLAEERTQICDVDDAGTRLLAFDGVFASKHMLRLYEISAGGIVQRASWLAKTAAGQVEKPVAAKFLADGKIAVQFDRQVVVWNSTPVEPACFVDFTGPAPRLAADRRHLLLEKDGAKFEVDLVAGNCVGTSGSTATSDLSGGTPSPDGKRLAQFKDSTLTLQSESGEKLDEFQATIFWPSPQLSWVDDKTLRLASPNQVHFIDVEHRVVLAEINGENTNEAQADWIWEKQQNGQDMVFTVAPVKAGSPQLPDFAAMRKRLPADPESMLLFKTGDRVRLSVSVEGGATSSAEIETAVRQMLDDRGIEVDENAKDELRASVAVRQESMEYRKFGSPPWAADGVESVTVQIVMNQLELVRDGTTVWSRGSSGGLSPMLHLNEGETAQDAANRIVGDGSHFWKRLSLPQRIAVHPNGRPWFILSKTPDGYKAMN